MHTIRPPTGTKPEYLFLIISKGRAHKSSLLYLPNGLHWFDSNKATNKKKIMYNHKTVQAFIDKVNKEAEEAAQKVYDKYNPELLQRIQNQLGEDAVVWNGMGTASITNKKGDDIAEELSCLMGQSQYWSENVSAGFTLPYNFTKTEILKP